MQFFYVLWFKLKNFTIEPFDMKKKIKKNPEITLSRKARLKDPIVYLKVTFQG